ncbi:hypothetical protein UPYG_G00155370 [Umbra pygmaea]|uniref:G-protein coupled receptors family 1 profile domain-containing protein n=1 Tax=Umbra pygmaea TaxID=75934 RepID=A0ABD0X253_UMBPY
MLGFVLQETWNNTEQNKTTPENFNDVFPAVWIQLTMAVLSLLGSASIVYATFQHLIRITEFQPLFLLSVTDFILAVSWLIEAVLLIRHCDNHGIFYNLSTVEQTLLMVSYFYTLNYVWTLYSGLKDKFYRSLNGCPVQCATKQNSFSKVPAVLSCVLPVVLMVPVFVTGNVDYCYTNFSQPYIDFTMDSACRLLDMYTFAVSLAAFIVTIVGIVVLMVKACTIYRRCVTSSGFLGDKQWASLRVLERRMLLYPSVFLFCWGPAVLVGVVYLSIPKTSDGVIGVILSILKACTSCSHGLLNSLVYGWTQRAFRVASKDAFRDMDTQTPLLRSQKKGYNTLWSSPSPNSRGRS